MSLQSMMKSTHQEYYEKATVINCDKTFWWVFCSLKRCKHRQRRRRGASRRSMTITCTSLSSPSAAITDHHWSCHNPSGTVWHSFWSFWAKCSPLTGAQMRMLPLGTTTTTTIIIMIINMYINDNNNNKNNKIMMPALLSGRQSLNVPSVLR